MPIILEFSPKKMVITTAARNKQTKKMAYEENSFRSRKMEYSRPTDNQLNI